MVREFSEEKRQEIFRLLDEIDNREWKSFMEWCGSSAEEFGDWPDKLAVSAYTKYVDKYHERVLETNEMTRNRVNTVFENVAEINTRYAGHMKECQAKVKEQIAMVRTMTEFMDSMSDGKPNMALLTNGSMNNVSPKVKDMRDKTININCYNIWNTLFGENCELEDCMKSIEKLHDLGFVSEEEYRNICELAEEKDNPNSVIDELRKCFNHVVTTVYIYNCLQVLANRTFSPEECCKANEIFRLFGITDRNSIANFLICCAGESGGFIYTQEIYKVGRKYPRVARGAGYIQVTGKKTQQDCLQYIYDLYGINDEIDENQLGYSDKVAEYPWEASAWYWTQYTQTKDGCLNNYNVERCGENGGRLILGIVLTTESFVNSKVSTDNEDGGYTMNDALALIVKYDSLRLNDNNGGWFVAQYENNNEDYRLNISAETIEYFKNNEDNEISASDIPSEWDTSVYLQFSAPNNWRDFEEYYNALQKAGLIDFDLNTQLP